MSFEAKRCGVHFSPPSIIVIYEHKETHKTRKRIIPVRNFSKCSDCGMAAERLKNNSRHRAYLEGVSHSQLERLHELLRDHMHGHSLQQSLDSFNVDPDHGHSLQQSLDSVNVDPDHGHSLQQSLDHMHGHSLQQRDHMHGHSLQQSLDSVNVDPDHGHSLQQSLDSVNVDPDHGHSLQQSLDSVNVDPDHGHSLQQSLDSVNVDPDEDLNKLDDEELARKKGKMDELFERNRRRKDDPEFVYDLEVEFTPASKERCSWDEDSDNEF